MKEPLIISVPGIPVAKGRPRMTRAGHTYTPAKTRSYEERVAWYGVRTMGTRPSLEGPLHLVLTVIVPIPASWSGKKKEMARNGELYPMTRPDLDNYIKVLDGLNGIVWKDDAQIVCLSAVKVYGDVPGLRIAVYDEFEPKG